MQLLPLLMPLKTPQLTGRNAAASFGKRFTELHTSTSAERKIFSRRCASLLARLLLLRTIDL